MPELRTFRRLRIVTGGQTGVDRAAMHVAFALGLPLGGWCPRGRRALDGPIDSAWPLQETPAATYAQRTRWNVLDSDATLLLAANRTLTGGTRLTRELADELGRDSRVVDPACDATEPIKLWIVEQGIRTLNIAGPRERRDGRVQPLAEAWLTELLAAFV